LPDRRPSDVLNSPTDSPAIRIDRLTKRYGPFTAVRELSLEIAEGEFFGFLGPNGAGKTTTLNAITGLANFSEGEIQVMGHDVRRDYKKTRALIGLVPQEFNFDPFLTVEEILFYTSGYFGLTRARARERARELLDQFSLKGHRRLDYKRLSGGLKRRLLIARSLVHRPRILILDEPTAGLDLEMRYQVWEELRRLNREGTTILLTSHYIEEAERLCRRVGVIFEGRLVACDTTERLIQASGRGSLEEVFAHLAGIKR